jgi:hypothetical protein
MPEHALGGPLERVLPLAYDLIRLGIGYHV